MGYGAAFLFHRALEGKTISVDILDEMQWFELLDDMAERLKDAACRSNDFPEDRQKARRLLADIAMQIDVILSVLE